MIEAAARSFCQSGAPGNRDNAMRTLRRIFSILLGVAAGVAAVKILKGYDPGGPIEGEFTELPTPEEKKEAAPGPGLS